MLSGAVLFLYTVERHIKISLLLQAGQHGAQAQIALFIVADSGQHLLIGGIAAHFLQLLCKTCQFVCVGGVVICHIGHQRQQLIHLGMLALAAAATAAATAIVIVVMIVMMVVMVIMVMVAMLMMTMVVVGARLVEMVVLVGVLMVVAVTVAMLVGMGNTVVGVLMGMAMLVIVAMIAHMIFMNMHKYCSFDFFFIITEKGIFVNKKERQRLSFVIIL